MSWCLRCAVLIGLLLSSGAGATVPDPFLDFRYTETFSSGPDHPQYVNEERDLRYEDELVHFDGHGRLGIQDPYYRITWQGNQYDPFATDLRVRIFDPGDLQARFTMRVLSEEPMGNGGSEVVLRFDGNKLILEVEQSGMRRTATIPRQAGWMDFHMGAGATTPYVQRDATVQEFPGVGDIFCYPTAIHFDGESISLDEIQITPWWGVATSERSWGDVKAAY